LTKLKYEIFEGQLNAPQLRRDRYNAMAVVCRGKKACQQKIASILRPGKVNFRTAKAQLAHKRICDF